MHDFSIISWFSQLLKAINSLSFLQRERDQQSRPSHLFEVHCSCYFFKETGSKSKRENQELEQSRFNSVIQHDAKMFLTPKELKDSSLLVVPWSFYLGNDLRFEVEVSSFWREAMKIWRGISEKKLYN